MKRLWVSLLVAGTAFVLPASAGAAVVTVSGGDTLDVNAGAGQVNLVTIARSGGNYIVTDTGTPPVAVLPCAPAGPAISCPAAGITEIEVELDNLNDSATLSPTVVGSFNLDAELEGEAGTDTLNGGANIETDLEGGDDGDFLNAGGEGDFINGGGGSDVMTGGEGDDQFIGGAGDDQATGGEGEDNFSSDNDPDGADSFVGGPDDDGFFYTQRFNAVQADTDGVADDGEGCPGVGCEGDNVGASVEGLFGGRGGDTLTGSGADNILDGEDGPDILTGLGGDDELRGDSEVDNLFGGAGEDELRSNNGSDRVFGGAGDDSLFSPSIPDEADLYSGGGGNDILSYAGPGSRRVDLDGRADDGLNCPGAGCEGDNVRRDVEDLVGGDGRDVLIGSGAANDFEGGIGNDRLVGGGGQDGLFGDEGNDLLSGGGAIDSLSGGAGKDRLRSRDRKRDEVFCGSSTDSVTGDRRDRIAPDCDRVRRGRRR